VKQLLSGRLGVPATTPGVDVKIAAAEAAAQEKEDGAMKKAKIEVGEKYWWKRGKANWPVRVLAEHPDGGYEVEITTTRRKARVADAAALKPVKPETAAEKPGAKKRARASKPAGERRPSGLDAAAQVLAKAGKPLSAKEIVERMLEGGLWRTAGKTPHATIYAAMIREIAAKGDEARFRKVGPGQFELASK
jgi:hypothetical protein